jgi:hypothetical protein
VLKANDWACQSMDLGLHQLRLELGQVLGGLLEAAEELGGIATVIQQDPVQLLVP